MASPGTSVEVRAGVYNENVTINVSGTASAPIRINSYDGLYAASIVPTTSSNTVAGWGVNYVLVQGFEITAPHAAGGDNDGIKFGLNGNTPNTYIAVVNNKVTVPADGNDGIKINQTAHAFVLGNWIVNPVEVGIDIGAVQFLEIGYNYVLQASPLNTFGIYVKMGTYTSILHDNYVQGTKHGIWIGQSSSPEFWEGNPAGARQWEARNCHAWNNVVRDVQSTGYAFMGAWNSSHSNSLVYSTGWINVMAAPQTANSTQLDCSSNTVSGLGVDQTTYYYNDPLQPDTTTRSGVTLGNVQNGTTGGETLVASYALVTTGTGADTVRIVQGSGSSEIFDFSAGSDVVELSGFGYSTTTSVLSGLRQVGPNVVLVLNDGIAIWFRNISTSVFSASNFVVN